MKSTLSDSERPWYQNQMMMTATMLMMMKRIRRKSGRRSIGEKKNQFDLIQLMMMMMMIMIENVKNQNSQPIHPTSSLLSKSFSMFETKSNDFVTLRTSYRRIDLDSVVFWTNQNEEKKETTKEILFL
ncbi:hypothetical protein NH340_JMT06989 [Sarcoptes scabiei]|nr:hypothetical protein NH340_JMT06989 [Sarcoptes scabiei]